MTQEESNEEPIKDSSKPPRQPGKKQKPKGSDETKNPSPDPPKSPSKDQKAQSTWDRFRSGLPEATRQAMQQSATARPTNLDADELDFKNIRETLPANIQEGLDSQVEVSDATFVGEPRFCLCEMPEGEFPRVKIFKSAEAMVRYIGQVEGQELSVWPFYGIPLRMTKSDAKSSLRYVYMPGELEAAIVPKSKREKYEMVDSELIDHLDYQDDGWLGDPAVAEGVSESYYDRHKKKRSDKPGTDGDEEESFAD